MGYKYGLYGSQGSTLENPAVNGCVFATADEALRARDELLSRWWAAPPQCVIVEVAEPPNYEFPVGTSRPRPLPKEV